MYLECPYRFWRHLVSIVRNSEFIEHNTSVLSLFFWQYFFTFFNISSTVSVHIVGLDFHCMRSMYLWIALLGRFTLEWMPLRLIKNSRVLMSVRYSRSVVALNRYNLLAYQQSRTMTLWCYICTRLTLTCDSTTDQSLWGER